jgi:hypothetical protein
MKRNKEREKQRKKDTLDYTIKQQTVAEKEKRR